MPPQENPLWMAAVAERAIHVLRMFRTLEQSLSSPGLQAYEEYSAWMTRLNLQSSWVRMMTIAEWICRQKLTMLTWRGTHCGQCDCWKAMTALVWRPTNIISDQMGRGKLKVRMSYTAVAALHTFRHSDDDDWKEWKKQQISAC
jgi:hypothetical protein